MNLRGRVLSTFKKEKVDKIVWQPRIYYWYYGNRLKNKLPEGYKDGEVLNAMYNFISAYDGDVPEGYKDKTMLEIYDVLNASPRYPQEVLGVELFRGASVFYRDVSNIDSKKLKCITKNEQGKQVIFSETPKGVLREVTRHGYYVEYPVKTLNDIKVMEYILDNTEIRFDLDAFEIADKEFGERGPIQSYYARSPLPRLIVNYMGAENTIYALNDYPTQMKEFLKVIEEWDDKMYEKILNSLLTILNFADNIDGTIISPNLFKEYLIPYYKKRINQIHQKGKFCHLHMDGSLKSLLPLINEAGFDGIEAATPLPQGDVTLEELKDALRYNTH